MILSFIPNRTEYLFLLFFPLVFILLCGTTVAAPASLTKISETLVADSAFDGNNPYWYLNAVVEQRDQLITCKGWQYAVYYKQKTGPSDRHVTICRRQLPSGLWQSFDFADYDQTTNDDHNGIAMGICPGDGTIHLAFDMHAVPLHYRRSAPDLANNPGSYTWSVSQFGAVGANMPPNSSSSMTYPKFATTPDGNLLFEIRDGGSGNGDEWLWKYSASTHAWTFMGKYIDGKVNDNNAYINGMQFDNIGRLQITWGWRETPDGTTEHDLLYAWSSDTGVTWYNSAGLTAGVIGITPITSTSVSSTLVWSIPQNKGLWDSEGFGIDRHNRPHTLIAHDTLGGSKLFHYYRDDSGLWHCNYTGLDHPYQVQRVVFDKDDNAYLPIGGGPIAAASAPEWKDWHIIDNAENGRFLYCALTYLTLARDSCILSTLNQGVTGPNSKKMYVLNYRMGASLSSVISGPTVNHSGKAKNSILKLITTNGTTIKSHGKLIDLTGRLKKPNR